MVVGCCYPSEIEEVVVVVVVVGTMVGVDWDTLKTSSLAIVAWEKNSGFECLYYFYS